jgi:arylsulfatase
MEIDWSVGQIMKTLKDLEINKNTLVIFTSDNGPWLAYGNHAGSALPLREGKGTTWEGGQREPCIIYYPNKIKAGTVTNTPMMGIDILPTIAEITGSELPEKIIDGKSVFDIWVGNSTESPHEAYFYYYRVNELHSVRYKNWKLYFPHNYRTMNGQPQGKDGLPGTYKFIDLETIELYDLDNDISETKNVASENPEIVEKIQKLADEMRMRLGDKLYNIEGAENRPAGTLK